ncbi:GNAT family N-acetyltransferase [Isoptericola sp. NPDC056605]|uniref:GNAT family N-acetyltransferase n=1 Tax=Isoptericola sp. NPDC056605 TaxID=3345876 RepID=UPI0036A213EE
MAALRDAMDADLAPRYAALRAERARLFAARAPGGLQVVPTAEEVLVTWLALVGDEPVATASLRRLGTPDAATDAVTYEVKRLFVLPAHRRRGLAAAALTAVEGSARERGIGELRLQTGVLQPEAVALYEREGWRRIPPYPPYPPESSVCFVRSLR